MHVLVTGATGFVGGHVCRSLKADGHRVTALSRRLPDTRASRPWIDRAFQWNPLEGPPPSAAFDSVDGVVHLAGESVAGRWTGRKKRAISESRVLGTRNLVAAVGSLSSPPRVLVSANAIGYYGDRGDETLTESSAPGSDFLAGVCRAWENEAAAARSDSTRVVPIRFGLILGQGGGVMVRLVPIFRMGLGGPLGSGRQWWSWIHVNDVVGLIRFALEREVDEPLNGTAPNPVTQREFAGSLAARLRRPAILPAPTAALKLALGEFSVELLSSKRVFPVRAAKLGYAFRYSRLDDALRDLTNGPRANA